METYKISKFKENEYIFETQSGLSYSMELKKSNMSYLQSNGFAKYIDIFRFSIFDKDYPIESDYLIRNTILEFILSYFSKNTNDEIMFFINNEYEKNNNSHRAKSRLKLFRRLFRIATRNENSNYIFLTNEHFILNHQQYKMDYIGIIIKTTSINFNSIVRAFNKFCHENSYQKEV
jgi:hypothetical protein